MGSNRVMAANRARSEKNVPGRRGAEVGMEAMVFFVIWLGGTLLHTLFDLRIKPVLRSAREESDVP